nr:CBASS cGAMP synthase [Acinetobacter tandoii]
MTWNFHNYYNDSATGLMGKLVLTDSEMESLRGLRKIVRARTRDVFNEAKQLVTLSKNYGSALSFRIEFLGTNFKYLKLQDQLKLAELIMELNDDLKEEFLKLKPRFWTQGSFSYDTLNRPYKTPPQEMDIDDGTYLPMQFFDDKPAIGHTLLLLLVDASLSSLAAEQDGWTFEAKETCGRIKIPARNVHIDVPMYAIPYDKFLEKEVFIEKSESYTYMAESYDITMDHAQQAQYECIDRDCVNLAVRKDDVKWIISDPKDVELWFKDACRRNGSHLRKICRILKAWRDAVDWEESNGPSSISLMAAIVAIVDSTKLDTKDFGSMLLTVAKKLPSAFHNGVESPDPNDERPLFPPFHEHEDKHKEIMMKLIELHASLESAFAAKTKDEALRILNSEYGNRVKDASLIVAQAAAPAYESTPKREESSTTISKSMKSA